MKISDFISETLSEVAIGVQTAKHNVASIASIAPGSVDSISSKIIEYIEFEIAVTVTKSENENKQKNGGAEIKGQIAVVSASLDGKLAKTSQRGEKSERISRLKFKVPIQLNGHFRADMKNNPDVWKEDKKALTQTVKSLKN